MKKLICIVLAVLLLASVLNGCKETSVEEDLPVLWYALEWESGNFALKTRPYEGEQTVPAMASAILAELPGEIGLLDWDQWGMVVRLYLPEAYAEFTGIDRTMANYCLALTLTQLEDVKTVALMIEGLPGQIILRPEDVVLSGAEEQPVELTAALYFRQAGGNELGMELRIFRLIESESATLAVLQALLAGPNEAGLTPVLPSELTVHSARVEGGVCYADFSAVLLEQIPETEVEQILVVRSVVESLCSLGHVQAVQILVDGEPLELYGQLDVSQPMNQESWMVQE